MTMHRSTTLPRVLSRTLTASFILWCLSASACAEQQSEPIEILLGDVSLNKLPFIVAYDHGIYEQNGLNIRPLFSQGSVDIIRRSGIDVSDEYIFKGGDEPKVKIGGAAPTIVRLTTRAGAWDPIVLGSTHRTTRWRIIAQPGIERPEDLKGKRIGYSGVGAITHFVAILYAEHMGWDPTFDWSMLGGGLGVDALDNNHIDAVVGPELHATMAVAAGYKLLVDLGELELPNAGSSFLFDRDWLAENEDAARAIVKSAVEAIALMKNDKQATFETLGKWYQMTDPELLEFFYAEVEKLPSKPYPPHEGIREVMRVYDSHEMRKYTLEHFYDDSYVRELDESGYIDSLYE